jgi:DNA-binding response OmpR family regulator
VHLVRNAGRAVSQSEIRESVFRTNAAQDSSSIRNHIRELRLRLGDNGALVQSVRGQGYGVGIETDKDSVVG